MKSRCTASLRMIAWVIPLFCLLGCSDKSTEPQEELSISLDGPEGRPGSVVSFTCDVNLSPVEDYALYFGDAKSPIFGTDSENAYDAMVPAVSSGNVSVHLQNVETNASSYSISFNILSLPQTGVTPGQVAGKIVATQEESFRIIEQVIAPNLAILTNMPPANQQALQSEIARAIVIMESVEEQLLTLSEDEKELFDQLLFSSGVPDLVASSNCDLARMAQGLSPNSMYTGHYVCAAMDGFSALLTAVNRLWTIAGLIASVGSGGTLAPIFVAGAVAMTIIDNAIDGFLPTDLNELYVENEGDLIVPLYGARQVRIIGRFTPQSNPVNATISSFVSAILGLGNIASDLESFVINTLTTMGIDVGDNLSSLTENWQDIAFVDFRIDPSYYEGGFGTFLAILGEYIGIGISNGSEQEFLSAIAGFDYHVENSSIATFDDDTGLISGLQLGSSELVYNGYRFKGFSGWAGVISSLLGIEWPQSLASGEIEECNFTVQEMTGNSIHIDSHPSGASVYLDGTNMNETTPTILVDVAAGRHHIRLYKFGYNEYNEYFDLNDSGVYMIDADLGDPLPPLPVFTIYSPADGQHFGDNVITVSGRIDLRDAYGVTSAFIGDRAIITVNGTDKEIEVTYGQFDESVSISAGNNAIRLRANNENGDTGTSDEITVYGDFMVPDIEITLTWNTPTSDLDLHVWNPLGEHCYYAHMTISDGSLDIDDVEGYGPETFTAPDALNGAYIVKVNCYSLDQDSYADATVVIRLNGEEMGTYGPHHFVVADYNGSDAEAWWDVDSFTIAGTFGGITTSVPQWLKEKINGDMRCLPRK